MIQRRAIIADAILLFAYTNYAGAQPYPSTHPNSRLTCVGDHLFTHEQQKTDSFIIDRISDPTNFRFAGAIYDGVEIHGDVLNKYKKTSKGHDAFLVTFNQATFFGKRAKDFLIDYDSTTGILTADVTYYKDGKEVEEGTYIGRCADTTDP